MKSSVMADNPARRGSVPKDRFGRAANAPEELPSFTGTLWGTEVRQEHIVPVVRALPRI